MVFCPNCGAQVEGRFCARCGTAVQQPQQQQQQQSQSSASAGFGAGAAPGTHMPPPPPPNYGGAQAPPPQYGMPGAASTTGGMAQNVAGLLCYVLTFITGAIFLAIEPHNRNPFVRFHAWQAIFFGASWFVINIALSIVFSILAQVIGAFALVGLVVWPLLSLVMLGIWIFLMVKAYNNERFLLPIIGPLAEKQANS